MHLWRVFRVAALVLAITSMPARAENPVPVAHFDALVAESVEREFDELQRQIATRHTWDNGRLAREIHHPESLVHETDASPAHIALRRTRALLNHLRTMDGGPALTGQSAALDALAEKIPTATTEPAQRAVFREIAALRRRIALSNPLLDFTDILFIKRHRSLFQHMCDQYYGIAANPGGGLHILENAFGPEPRVRDLLAESVVENGRLKGQPLRGGPATRGLRYDGNGRLTGAPEAGGAFLSPDLSFCGTRILFSYVEGKGDTRHRVHWEGDVDSWSEHWDPQRAFHVFTVNLDGSGLTQLTDGPWNDIHPCWLPDGDIAFISERRGGFLRCGRVCPVYTLHRMDARGKNLRPLSYHETHEWLPSVDHHGQLAYTRWDYVDRDSDIAHHLWLKNPDGRDPRAPHGNYPKKRESRPWMEMSIRAIPGSHKYLAVAAPHHGQHFGSLITIDLRIDDDRATSQIRRVTPEVMFPEAESAPGVSQPVGRGGRGQVFGTPWPLDENFYLAVHDPGEKHHAMVLADAFGNRDLLYLDPAIGISDPIPLRPRPVPPVIPDQTRYAENADGQTATGTVTVMDVYDSLLPWPEGTRLKELRLIQLFPKSTPAPDVPWIGSGTSDDQSLARGVIGTVPIEDDGSAHFEMPAGVPFYMQALDERGLAVQTMRSATYLHPGERMSCIGCHEPKNRSPRPPPGPLAALSRPPSRPQPEAEGSYPLSFPRLVQPVLDRKCVECHEDHRADGAPGLRGDVFAAHGHSEAFRSLAPFAWAKFGGNHHGIRRNQTSYSIPGQVGARASKLHQILENGHHDVNLTAEELRRITLWLDANSLFYGSYHDPESQARGGKPQPRIE